MSSFLSVKIRLCTVLVALLLLLTACDTAQLNNPYSENEGTNSVLYQSFSERPKHLDPAKSYSNDEYAFLGQIYEPVVQYAYLKRPYTLEPLTAVQLPQVQYFNAQGAALPSDAKDSEIAFTDYSITLKPNILYQPHPALAKTENGAYRYHHLNPEQLEAINSFNDFSQTGTRELVAEDYVYQIKRLADPKLQSPIAEVMKNYIVGFDEFGDAVRDKPKIAIKNIEMSGVSVIDRYRYKVRIKGKYPQFSYWLAMPFFSAMPWEADEFYEQAGLKDKNITLDWYPIGTGAYLLAENNPNRRMILLKNPNFHYETYPQEGEDGDNAAGLLADAGKRLPFIDKVVFMLEKETIPYWTKFLQGYYDASGIASDSFDQAIQFTGSGGAALTPSMLEKGIRLQTSVSVSDMYLGFNMLDPIVGGDNEQARKLRQAIAIAVDYEEYISIFMNGRGVAAQGILPPEIYGYAQGKAGMNPYVYDWINDKPQRKPITAAKTLLTEAGYDNGIDPKTKQALILYFDTTSTSVDDRSRLNWYRKQFEKLGIKLVVRATDYNRFQEKIRENNSQLFFLGWNADYPDAENFFFLLHGANSKVKYGGENASNYINSGFDKLFEAMRNKDNDEERYQMIQVLQDIVRYDAPWLFGFHPKNFSLFHSWYKNVKPNLMAHNQLKYTRIDAKERELKRKQWNQADFMPLIIASVLLILGFIPALRAYRKRVAKSY
ncbi:MAG: ABC transporter substrate-binding protein [Methylococcaceae bacterium]